MFISEENEAKVRKALKDFDDERRGAFMWVWAQVSDNPKKAGWVCLAVLLAGFFLGRLSK